MEPEPRAREETMKALAADESLSEEARESAKKALEVLVSSQLLDIEQEAAVKKRAGALKELESEAQFVNQQAQIERHAATQKLEAEAQDEIKKVEAETKKFEAEIKKAEAEAKRSEERSEEMTKWLERHRLQIYAGTLTRIAGRYAAFL